MLNVIAGIAWDPEIRGLLATAVGVVVLMGSVYLLVATNVGHRLGFMIAAAAFFGWMVIMGLIWWIYGSIGMRGADPHWQVQEVIYPTLDIAALAEAHDLDTSVLPPPEELRELTGDDFIALRDEVEPQLGGWHILPESDPSFGQARAAVDAYLLENPIEGIGDAELQPIGDVASDYVNVFAFQRGGKDSLPDNPSRLDRITNTLTTTFWQVQHPPHYAIVQVQPVRFQETEPGQPPPRPEPDPSAPVISVIMERDLGQVRLPAAMLTIVAAIMFGVLCSMLHRRDQLVDDALALPPVPVED